MHTLSKTTGDDLDWDDQVTLRFDDSNPLHEDFNNKVQEAQEHLVELRRQQNRVEKQKTELEELNQMQGRFVQGRRELSEKLNRAMAMLDRETYETQTRADQLDHAKDTFTRHLDVVESLHPEEWERPGLRAELTRALGVIEEAETDYSKTLTTLRASVLNGGSTPPTERGSDGQTTGQSANFKDWFLKGLAFTTPLMIFIAFVIVLRSLLEF